MLDLTSFTTDYNALYYHGANRYIIAATGSGYKMQVDVLDEYFEDVERTENYCFSALSAAIAAIEQMERGEAI